MLIKHSLSDTTQQSLAFLWRACTPLEVGGCGVSHTKSGTQGVWTVVWCCCNKTRHYWSKWQQTSDERNNIDC